MTAFTITATDNGDAAALAGGGPVAITVTLPSTSAGGTGTVDSVVAGTGISVNATDPANPVVTNTGATAAQGTLADSATQPGDLATVATTGGYSDLTGKPTLGTAAAKDIPATGDASSTQVVYGTDTRLTNARTPAAHASTHASAGSDPVTIAESQVTGLTTDLAGKVPTTRTVAGHALSADVTLVKGDVGLGNVDNTADTAKTFTESQVTGLVTDLAAKAPLASPALTGHPTGVTEAAGDNSTRLASTAYVDTAAGLLVAKSLVDAKGDLLAGTADNTVARLAVGTNGQVLTADSAQTAGVKWAAASGSVATDTIFDAKGDLAVGTAADTAAKLTVGADGKALVADSTTTTGLAYKSLAPTDDIPWLSGSLYGCPYGNFVSSTATPTANDLVLMPFPVGRSFSLTALAATAATSGTGVLRLGVYSSGSNGLPSSLLFEAGTVTPGAGAGVKTVAATQTLSPGLYWMAYLVDSANGTFRVFTAINRALFGWDNLSPGSMNLCLRATGVTAGALPSTAPTLTPTSAINPIRVFAVAA